MLLTAAVAVLFGLATAQPQEDCVYHLGGLELDLYQEKGRELYYQGNGVEYRYTICADNLQCEHMSGEVDAMIDLYRDGTNECHFTAQWDPTVLPFYDFAIATWIFNFSNGEPCPDQSMQVNRSTQIGWNCNPEAESPHIVDVFHYDSCNDYMEIEWEGACNPAPPPNERCEFRFGFQTLNLSTIQGMVYTINDTHNNQWRFSPCANQMKCLSQHGSTLDVMADVIDPSGQCIKFLGIWAGDALPFYDRTVFGQDYWDFFWMDGQECGDGGPAEVLNVRYYCTNSTKTTIVAAGGAGPCNFRIDIETPLACHDSADLLVEEHEKHHRHHHKHEKHDHGHKVIAKEEKKHHKKHSHSKSHKKHSKKHKKKHSHSKKKHKKGGH